MLKATVERAHAVFQEAYARFVAAQRAERPSGVAELKLPLATGATRSTPSAYSRRGLE